MFILQLLFAGNVSAASMAVFPVADLSKGDNSVNFELTRYIVEELQYIGVDVLPLDEVIAFMARNRIRYLGYLDTGSVLKVKHELGLDLVMLGTVSQQSDKGKPGVGLSLQLLRSGDAHVVWSDSRGRSVADEQKLLGLNEPHSLEELQKLVTTDLLAGLPADLDEIAVPPEGSEEEMARQPKIEIVTLGPKYIRPGEQIKCAVRVVTVSDAYEAPEVFIKVGSRVHLAREARDPLIYAEYEGEVYEATREYEDIIKEAEAEANQFFREAGVDKSAPLREAEEDLPRFREADRINQTPLREAADDDRIFRAAENLDRSPLVEVQRELKKQDQDDSADHFFAQLVNSDLKYNINYAAPGSGEEAGDEQGIFRAAETLDRPPLVEAEDNGRIFREAETLDRPPLMEAEDNGRIFREAETLDRSPLVEAEDDGRIFREADELSPVRQEAAAGENVPVLQATNENSVYYEASWVGSDSMSGTSEAQYNSIGTPTVDVAMAANDSRFFEGIWSGTERDDRYPVSLVLRWPDGKQVVSFLGSYTVDSHPPRIGLDIKGDVYDGIVTFRDKLTILPRLFNREPISHWEIIIEDTMGNVVRKNRGWGNLPTQFVWRGRHTNGLRMPDGIYRIVLKVWDRAENMGSADQSVALMKTPPTIKLSAVQQDKEFSIDISHAGNLPLAHWYLEIRSQSGRVIKSVEGGTLPATVDLQLTTALKKDKLFGIVELRDILGNKSRREIDDLYLLALQKKEPEIQEKEKADIKVESWDADF